jgi:hypothetical protein
MLIVNLIVKIHSQKVIIVIKRQLQQYISYTVVLSSIGI